MNTKWENYIHGIRKKEFEIAFRNFDNIYFENALEVGCGDGYQSTLLAEHCRHLIAGDYNFERIKFKIDSSFVEYVRCDAEKLLESFNPDQFDLIFSSNLIEHLPSPELFLCDIHTLLMNKGFAVHAVPNRFFKINHLLFYHLNLLRILIGRIGSRLAGAPPKEKKNKSAIMTSNVKSERVFSSRLAVLWPKPHGEFKSHFQEFINYGKRQWKKKFLDADFEILQILHGPAASGYGWGLDSIRTMLERMGFCSEFIFITKKK